MVYAASSHQVTQVWINGRQVVRDRERANRCEYFAPAEARGGAPPGRGRLAAGGDVGGGRGGRRGGDHHFDQCVAVLS